MKGKEEFESPKIQEINGNDGSYDEFKNEIKEIIEEKADSEIDTSEFKIKENDSNLSELANKSEFTARRTARSSPFKKAEDFMI